MSNRSKLIPRLVILLPIALVLSLLVSPVTAGADRQYVGQSPRHTNCDSDAVTTRSMTMKDPRNNRTIGQAYLRHSNRCGADWVLVTYASGYFPIPSAWMQNRSGTDQRTAGDAPYQGKVWTNMVEGRNVADCGGVQIHDANYAGGYTSRHVGWFYLGCY